MHFSIILLLLGLLLFISRPFTILFHELGHAIPALLLTKQRVAVYVGSYGDPNKCWHLKIGLLELWIKYHPGTWRRGVCVPSAKQISINKQIIYTLTGPLASLVLALLAAIFFIGFDFHGLLKLILFIVLASSLSDFILNLIPNKTPIQLYTGSLTHNDGYQLKQLLEYRKYPKEFEQAVELYHQQKYAAAADLFNSILAQGIKEENIYRLAISSFLQVKNYKQAKDLIDQFIPLKQMNSDDYSNAGLAYSMLDLHSEAMNFYDASLALNPNHLYTLNNKGFMLILRMQFEESIRLLDKAIEIDPQFAYSYNNRGLAKVKLGLLEEGLADIQYSLSLDANNSYAYRNLGVYHQEKGELSEALALFKQAKSMDTDTYGIEELLQAVS